MTKIGYARVSSKEQNLERQFELLELAEVKKIFSDKLSGKDNNRPQLKEMLNYIREDDIKSSPDSCVKCYTMFLPFLLIKINVFS